jgi:hypothetical protein
LDKLSEHAQAVTDPYEGITLAFNIPFCFVGFLSTPV